MHKRKSKNYIILGTVHLGFDLPILDTVKTVADHYGASVIHVGPLVDRFEYDMWRRRERKLRTWEKARYQSVSNQSDRIKTKLDDLETAMDEMREKIKHAAPEDKGHFSEKLKRLKERAKELASEDKLLWERLGEDVDRLVEEKCELEEIQWGRIEALREVFGSVKFVCNDELHIPHISPNIERMLGYEPEFFHPSDDSELHYVPRKLTDVLGDDYVDRQLKLGSHLYVTAVPANGDKMSGAPITPRTFRMLKEMGESHIVPHMTPHIKPFPRPGLNQAYNFWTTGSIQFGDHPKRISDAYKSAAKASCVLVSVDEENGEFHAQRLRVKIFWGSKNHKKIPHIIHDGLVFDSSGNCVEVETADKGLHVTDLHAPHEHRGVVASVRALNVLHKPILIADGGDTADNESISPHTESKPGEREGLRLIDDIRAMVNVLHDISNEEEFPWIDIRVMLDSNHGEWITKLVAKYPFLEGLCDWKTIAKTFLPDWEVFIRTGGDDKFYKFGDLTIKHADREGTINKAHETYGNYLGGHHHSFQELGDAVFAGPGCGLGPKYLQNSATSWQNQVTTITRYKGKTCKHPKTVLHTEDKKVSRFTYRGEIWEVKEYERPKK